MTKHNRTKQENAINRRNFREWRQRRDIALRAIPLEVDLDNREIILGKDFQSNLDFSLVTSNVDRLISNYVDPKDSQMVKDSLVQAQQGKEKPIVFNFIHPRTAQKLRFEYRYEIVYVRYASTRLNGVLVNLREKKQQSTGLSN